MEDLGWIKIREANKQGKYEVWDSKSGILYGLDEQYKNLLVKNSNIIKTSENLKNFIDFINDDQTIIFNKNFELYNGGENIIIVNKENDSEFVANEIIFDICKTLEEEKLLSVVLEKLKEIYELTKEDEIDVISAIMELVNSGILILPL